MVISQPILKLSIWLKLLENYVSVITFPATCLSKVALSTQAPAQRERVYVPVMTWWPFEEISLYTPETLLSTCIGPYSLCHYLVQ